MGKDIGQIYKHSQPQLSTSSFKGHVSSYSETQTFSAIKLTTTSVPFVTNKHFKNNSVLCYQNTTQNDSTITTNDDI